MNPNQILALLLTVIAGLMAVVIYQNWNNKIVFVTLILPYIAMSAYAAGLIAKNEIPAVSVFVVAIGYVISTKNSRFYFRCAATCTAVMMAGLMVFSFIR